MKVELICVGNELLSGDVVNTNAAYIAKELKTLGHESLRQFTIDDNKSRLSELVLESFGRCDIVILTGGLGPTADDITKEAVCKALGLELVENKICLKHLENFFKKLGKTPTQNNYKQTLAPKGANIFINDLGTACGIDITINKKRIILLPGPPKELTYMFDTYVTPILKELSNTATATRNLNVFGLGESEIETKIKDYCGKENPVVATYWGSNECRVSITATAKTQTEADKLCSKTILDIKSILGDNVYGTDSRGLAFEVINALRASNLKISTAESCTGGMLSQSLTSVPYSSEAVEIGILAYSNRIKQEALSVPAQVLNEKGAISKETAMYLAKNVRILSDSDIGVSITGNAGPSASENKPVGLVYIALADRTKYYVKKLTLSPSYDREKIRSYATLTALDLVRRYIAARPFTLDGMIDFNEEFYFEDELTCSPEPEIYSVAPEKPETPSLLEFEKNVIILETESDDLKNKPIRKSKKRSLNKILGYIFPTKRDSLKDVIIKIVSLLAVISLISSSAVLVTHFAHEAKQRLIISSARDDFDFENTEKTENNTYSSFTALQNQNSDIRAWISISNTNIDNPVYQTQDNDYYLTHNMNKAESRFGALFFDYRDVLDPEKRSKNITIYGHNMKDQSMFATLLNYRNLSFYKNNPYIELKTLYSKETYVIFSVMITASDSLDDNGSLFAFYRPNFDSTKTFTDWLAEAKERSIIDTTVSVNQKDEILTLSTCCYDFEGARFIVMAKKISANEKNPNLVAKAKFNPNTRYPQVWYDIKGLEGYVPSNNTSSNPESRPTESVLGESANTSSAENTLNNIASSVSSTATN